jgi:hypothetical protein
MTFAKLCDAYSYGTFSYNVMCDIYLMIVVWSKYIVEFIILLLKWSACDIVYWSFINFNEEDAVL